MTNLDRFKIRVWYKPRNIMMYDAVFYSDDKNIGFSDHYIDDKKHPLVMNEEEAEMWGHEGFLLETYGWTWCDNEEHFEIMQCTGLIDEEEDCIYEGDILLISKETKVQVRHGLKKGVQGFYLNKIGNFFKEQDRVFMSEDDKRISLTDYNYKIIGNIYENPELMKEENDA